MFKHAISRQAMFRVVSCLAFLLMPAPSATAREKAIDFGLLDPVVMEELKERHTPGAALAIVIGDRVVYAKGYGVASIESPAPVTPETLFRMGSTTKMFTAAALVTLADQGKINLDAPIGEVVKGLHPSLARLTSHQLLSQSAGLRDFAAPINSHDDAALGQNVRAWKDDVFFTDPGKIFSYSSPGYWLAGFVAESVHGKPYADTMEELLFKPLGMTRSTLRPLLAATYPLAMGHNVESDRPVVIRPIYDNAAMWPGGSIFSNVLELSRFVIAMLHGGKLEDRQALSSLVASKLPARQVRMPGSPDAWYGYGLMSYETHGVRLVTHGGASRGYGSTIDLVPAHNFAVIVLTNKSGETLSRSRRKALELALRLKADAPDAAPTPLPMGAEEMRRYVGVYEHAPLKWEIFVRDGHLMFKDESGDHPLTKIGEGKFSYGDDQIVLTEGADGKIEHLFMGLYSARKER